MECTICFEGFNLEDKIPKNLLCGHMFCQACISSLFRIAKTSAIQCPLCQRKTVVNQMEAGKLPTAYMVKDLLEEQEKKRMDTSKLQCETHGESTIMFVCRVCRVGLCSTCMKLVGKSNHRDHDIETVDEFIQEINGHLVQDVRKIDDAFTEIKVSEKKERITVEEKVKEMKKILSDRVSSVQDTLKKWEEECLETIRNYEENQDKDICKRYDHTNKELEKTQEHLKEHAQSFRFPAIHDRLDEDLNSAQSRRGIRETLQLDGELTINLGVLRVTSIGEHGHLATGATSREPTVTPKKTEIENTPLPVQIREKPALPQPKGTLKVKLKPQIRGMSLTFALPKDAGGAHRGLQLKIILPLNCALKDRLEAAFNGRRLFSVNANGSITANVRHLTEDISRYDFSDAMLVEMETDLKRLGF